MKQATAPIKKSNAILSPELKRLQAIVENTKKATAKSLEAYDHAASEYQITLQKAPGKIEKMQGLCALKIAKFSYKIKKSEQKLALATLKLKKKALKKAAHEAVKETIPGKSKAAKPVSKGVKKGMPAKG